MRPHVASYNEVTASIISSLLRTADKMAQALTVDRLLNQVPDSPSIVLQQLRQRPDLASKQDSHGYSLLHAAASYGHIELATALVKDLNVDPNILDEDSETCLYNTETVEMAKDLVELGVDASLRNSEGQTAAEKLQDEDEQPLVAQYLRSVASSENSSGAATSALAQTGRASASEGARNGTTNGEAHAFPPMPNGVHIDVGTMADDAGDAPDPEFRRRIEELAARSDFEGEEGQRELRDLISDAVTGISQDGQGPASRRRLG
jgi:hypothetical protein